MIKVRRDKTKSDEPEELDDDEADELLKKAKRIKVEKELARQELELEETRKKLEGLRSSNIPDPTDVSKGVGNILATLIKSGVSPDDANNFLKDMSPEVLSTLMSLTASSGNPYLPLFMFIAAQSRGGSQQLTIKDMVDINKTILDTAKEMKPQGSSVEGSNLFSTLFKALVDILIEDREKAMAKAEEPRMGFWDQVIESDKLQRLQQLLNPGATPPEVQLKLEEMRQQHDLKLEEMRQQREREKKQFDLEFLKLKSELKGKKRMDQLMANVLRKFGNIPMPMPVETSAEQPPVQQAQPAPTELDVTCPSCNSTVRAKVGEPTECPNCHSKLIVKPAG